MATTNHDRVGTGMDLLRTGLAPFVEREVINKAKARAVSMETIRRFAENPNLVDKPIVEWGCGGFAEAHVGHVERGLSRHPGLH